MITRYFKMQDADNESVFLFGARQTGKTTFLQQRFPKVRYFDLLKADVFERLNRHPELLREEKKPLDFRVHQ
ncbi:hypothetical protein FACS189430_02870 [Bacteroidia bacterium]|nr:hypothetical protein FACS189430_02870 [Bacteroidia bacterium]